MTYDKFADNKNNIMSFGLHNYIKIKCVKSLKICPYSNVIDLCTGTGDIARIIKKFTPNADVTGIDFSENMLEIAVAKSFGEFKDIKYFQGDVTNLPYKDNSFDVVTMGFGLRNIFNAEKAVEEIYRVLSPGGSFLHVDFNKTSLLSKIYDKITPVLVSPFTENKEAYKYLIKSRQNFLTPEELIKDFESKGFKLKKRKDYLFGIISSQIMEKS